MEVRRRFDTLSSQGRATTDLAIAARAATVGAVDTLLVAIDRLVPGEVDEATGAISPVEGPQAHGVADEIARRVWATGGRVLAVRADEVPGGGAVAALLRHPLA
jgi:hypothetical protein